MSGAETVTAKELGEALGKTDAWIKMQAQAEGWKYTEEPCNGGVRWVFALNDLPAETKAQLIQRQESSYIKGMVLPARADLDLGQARALLAKFEAAPVWSRRKAEARGEIVEAFEREAEDRTNTQKGKNLTKAKKDFIRRYNVGNDGLGVSAETYTNIDTLTRGSLDRWRALKREFGLVGLLDATRNRQSFCQLTDEHKQYIISLKTARIHTRAVRVYEYLQNKFATDKQVCPCHSLPSAATVRRFLQNWERENVEYVAFLRNPDKWRSDYQSAMGDASEKAKYFLHMLEFDNTPADVRCADGRRYTVCGGIDIFSRKAKVLIAPTSRSITVANLMRNVILDWGLYDVMIADNGKDFASRHIEAAAGALGIHMPPLPAFTPEAKPHIERFFRSLAEGLFEELDGFTGHNVAQAQDLRAQKAFAQRLFDKGDVIECSLSAQDLQAKVTAWLETIYHQREHGSLGMSPEAKAGQSAQPVRRILDERVLDILLASVGTATVGKKGIRFETGDYVGVELADVIGQKVELRRNYSDAGMLYVFDLDFRFLCIAKDQALEGLTVEEVNTARARQKKRVREQVRALKALAKEVGDPMTELLEAKAAEAGKVVAFRREVEAESQAITEASRAVAEPEEQFEEFRQDDGRDERRETRDDCAMRNDGKVVKLREEEPFFERTFERYKYLRNQMNIRNLTEREKGFMEGYEATEEYYKIFVMPYE